MRGGAHGDAHTLLPCTVCALSPALSPRCDLLLRPGLHTWEHKSGKLFDDEDDLQKMVIHMERGPQRITGDVNLRSNAERRRLHAGALQAEEDTFVDSPPSPQSDVICRGMWSLALSLSLSLSL